MEISLKSFCPGRPHLAAITAILLCGLSAHADDKAPGTGSLSSQTTEIYGGFAVGQTKLSTDVTIVKGAEIDETNSGQMLFLGSELGKGWAAEVFYAKLGEIEWSGKAGNKYRIGTREYSVVDDTTISAKTSTVGITGKYSWDVRKKTRLYAKLGIHSWKTKALTTYAGTTYSRSADGVDAMGGLGIEYAISEKVRIIAGLDNYVIEEDDISLSYVGLRFGFN